jgi:uncharacterized Fe-S center protein
MGKMNRGKISKKVFFIPTEDGADPKTLASAVRKLFEESKGLRIISRGDLLAIKVHVGEKGNITHVRPEPVAEIVKMSKKAGALPFLTETSTLYKGERENAVKHILLAHAHGFGIDSVGAPFIMADGIVGNTETEVAIEGKIHDRVKVAREVILADALIAISHATGHIGTGLGGCIKNLGMGLTSRMGKMRQHSAIHPKVIEVNCQNCKKCIKWCPEGAIIERNGKSFIIEQKCIGCGECLAVCRFDAIQYNFGTESSTLQKNMAEHALGCTKGKEGKAFFFNFLINMTKDCDCLGTKQKKIVPDIGILASDDPVAIDKATLDLTEEFYGKDLARLSYPNIDPMIQIRHGEAIGLGSLNYELVKIS